MPDFSAEVVELCTVSSDSRIRDVVVNLDQSMLRVAFVVDGERVVGAISDGDIRRALLTGCTLESPISTVFNRDFSWVSESDTPAEIQRKFREGIDVLPVLNDEGVLVRLVRRGAAPTVIPVAGPEITSYEIELVLEAVRSGWVSSVGRFVTEFESEFSSFIDAEVAVSTNNGTSALALAMWALGVGPGDEVLVPNLTFGATANAVIQVGARPVLVDISPLSWSLTPETMQGAVNERTKAIMVVHLYGYPAPLDAIREFAAHHRLLVIEDCAEALGTEYRGSHVGSQSEAAAFSFFGNKTITTGEGGMVAFTDLDAAARARQIRAHGMSSERRYWHEAWGTNLRMTNLQAALGLGQLRRIDSILSRKLQVAEQYDELLGALQGMGLVVPAKPSDGIHGNWLYTLLLPPDQDTDLVGAEMLRDGVETRRVFFPLHLQPAFHDYKIPELDYGISEEISRRGLSLPSSVTLTREQAHHVVRSLERALRVRS